MQRVIPLKPASQEETATALLEQWRASLQDHDRSAGTVKKYTQAVAHFLAWIRTGGAFAATTVPAFPHCPDRLPQRTPTRAAQIHQHHQPAHQCLACIVRLAGRSRIPHDGPGGAG